MLKSNLKIFFLRFTGSVFLFIITFLLSKKMTLAEYGVYEVLMRVSLLISTFALFGLPALINRAKNFFEARRLFLKAAPTVFAIDLIISFLTCIFLLIFKGDFKHGVLIIAGGFFYPIYRLIGTIYLKKKEYVRGILSDDVFFYLIFFLLILVFSKARTNLIETSFFLLAARLVVFLYFWSIGRYKLFKPNINIELLKESFFLFSQAILQKLVNNLPVIICGFLFSQQDAGVFALSTRLSSVYLIILGSFNLYITPKISENKENSKFKKMILKGLLFFTLLSIIVFIVNMICADFITLFWEEIKDEYLLIYFIILVGYLINLATGSVGVILNMIGKEKNNIQINILSLVLITLSSISVFFHNSLFYFAICISTIIGLENIIKLFFTRKYFKNI